MSTAKFGDWIQKGFDLYKENLLVLLVATLIATVLSSITAGVLSGPMMAGLALMALRLLDKTSPKPEMMDVFKGFDYFLDAFLFVLVWSALSVLAVVIWSVLTAIPILGCLIAILLPLLLAVLVALQALLMFGMFLIVDRKMPFWPASVASIQKVLENFWPFLGLFIVASLIASVGSLFCGVGAVVTMPIMGCTIAVAYREVFGGGPSNMTTITPEPTDTAKV